MIRQEQDFIITVLKQFDMVVCSLIKAGIKEGNPIRIRIKKAIEIVNNEALKE